MLWQSVTMLQVRQQGRADRSGRLFDRHLVSSAVVILLLVMDPVGNVPLFVSVLRDIQPARRNRIIMRECAIAFAVLLLFVVSGRFLLDLLGLSESSLNIAGGVILFPDRITHDIPRQRAHLRRSDPGRAIHRAAGDTIDCRTDRDCDGYRAGFRRATATAGMDRGADGGDFGHARAAAVRRQDQQLVGERGRRIEAFVRQL